MGNHRDLRVWQRANQFAGRVDRESRRLGRGHGDVADQIRRASLSIQSNIAEGSSRRRDAEFVRYINLAVGSASEVDSILAHLELIAALDKRVLDELNDDLTVIRKMLYKLRSAL